MSDRRRALLTASLGLLAGLLAACAPQSKIGTREITDETRVSQVREGTTTKADLLRLFGKPDAVRKTTSPEHGDEEVWVYYYGKSTADAGNIVTRAAVLAIYFKPGGDVVRRVVREERRINTGGAPPDRPR